MDMSALLSSTPPAVAIEEPVWAQMVSYPLAPACENERLQRLIYHGFEALSQAPSGQVMVDLGISACHLMVTRTHPCGRTSVLNVNIQTVR